MDYQCAFGQKVWNILLQKRYCDMEDQMGLFFQRFDNYKYRNQVYKKDTYNKISFLFPMSHLLQLFRAQLLSEVSFKEEKRKRKIEQDHIINEISTNSIHNEIFPTELIEFIIISGVISITRCLVCIKMEQDKCNHVTSEEFSLLWKLGSVCKRFRQIVLNWIEIKNFVFIGSPKINDTYEKV